MERTNANAKETKKMGCPCMEMNEKYSKGFSESSKSKASKKPNDTWVIEEDEIEFDNKKNR